jgi:hypothetical protein
MWGKRHNNELKNMCCSPSVIGMDDKMGSARGMHHLEYEHKILVERPERRRLLVIPQYGMRG